LGICRRLKGGKIQDLQFTSEMERDFIFLHFDWRRNGTAGNPISRVHRMDSAGTIGDKQEEVVP
jgi:hypothetical protein